MATEAMIERAARPDSKPMGSDLFTETVAYGYWDATDLVRARLTLEMYDLPDLEEISAALGLRETGFYRPGEVYRLTH
jgi:hypothetical protein